MSSLIENIRQGLSKTRSSILEKIDGAVKSGKLGEDFFEELEEAFILSDVGFETSLYIVNSLRNQLGVKKGVGPEQVKQEMVHSIREVLVEAESPIEVVPPYPFVILVVGVNGSGKTTTIGKVAHKMMEKGHSVLLGAGDTFRAAAIEQLEIWGKRGKVDLIKHKPGGDSSAVAFDTIQSAVARNKDVVLIDTAGRLHTKKNLMEELGKVKRVITRALPHAPSETLLVLDATTGQNSISQAQSFHEALGVTGLAVTKLDGTAKGGVLLAITREMKIPIRFVGVGEGIDDLKTFRAKDFARALLFDE